MSWNQLMIDIECAGTGRNAALMAIGAAFFDIHKYEIGPTFVVPIHVVTSVRLGMEIEPSAFLWWLRQGEAARRAVTQSLVRVEDALDQLTAYIEANSRPKDLRVWGNSSSFDMGITANAYRLAGKEVPWGFGKETCFRTVRNMNSHVVYAPSEREGTHHEALDDALFQIEHLFKIRKFNLIHRPLVMPT